MLRRKTRELLRMTVLGGLAAVALLVIGARAYEFTNVSQTPPTKPAEPSTSIEEAIPPKTSIEPVIPEMPDGLMEISEPIHLVVREVTGPVTGEDQATEAENLQEESQQPTWRYIPTEEEFIAACKLAFAEAGIEGSIGQTAVVEVVLNSIEAGYADDVLEEINRKGRYSTVRGGVICFYDGKGNVLPVTEEYLSDDLKEAVMKAFMGERPTEDALRLQAEAQGLTDECYWKGGAIYFFNWDILDESAKASRDAESMPVRTTIGHHTFARYWR